MTTKKPFLIQVSTKQHNFHVTQHKNDFKCSINWMLVNITELVHFEHDGKI